MPQQNCGRGLAFLGAFAQLPQDLMAFPDVPMPKADFVLKASSR
jgi:hypothetical protein